MAKVGALIIGDIDTTIGAQDQVSGVTGVDPEGMVIGMGAASLEIKGFSAIFAGEQGQAGGIDPVLVLRVYPEVREIIGTHFNGHGVVDFLPLFSHGIGAVKGCFSGFQQGVKRRGSGWGYGDVYPTEIAGWKSCVDLMPGLAAIQRRTLA